MALDRVSTSGAALAALLASLATSPSDVDGFILGDCHPGYCKAHLLNAAHLHALVPAQK